MTLGGRSTGLSQKHSGNVDPGAFEFGDFHEPNGAGTDRVTSYGDAPATDDRHGGVAVLPPSPGGKAGVYLAAKSWVQ